MSFEPFKSLRSRTTVLPQSDIDTDQIIPARFLTTTDRNGLGQAAFRDWRFDSDGRPLNSDPFRGRDQATHQILVAGPNFGCGSSREHAPWALLDFGFRAVISTDIADIFKSNALKNGLLALEIDHALHERLCAESGLVITIDVQAQTLIVDDVAHSFEMDRFARHCLIEGVDPLGYLLNQLEDITAFEGRQ